MHRIETRMFACMYMYRAHSFVRPESMSNENTEKEASYLENAASSSFHGIAMPKFSSDIEAHGDRTVLDYHHRPHSMRDCEVVESIVLGDALENRYGSSGALGGGHLCMHIQTCICIYP
jgi:hypothetical protein